MSLKIVFGVCLALVVLEAVLGAPHNSRKEQDLQKSFIEFIQQDKELSALLQNANLGPASLSRTIRQAENDLSDEITGEEQPKPGFFDRAAKFVMEVLQRFLKWINTED